MIGSLIIEGVAELQSQESGYCHPVLRLDGNPLVDQIAEHFGVRMQYKADDGASEANIGRLRITVEVVEENER